MIPNDIAHTARITPFADEKRHCGVDAEQSAPENNQMEDITTVWRPRQRIRVVAIGVPFRDGKLLACAVTEDDGTVKGWRPLGGGVEFGESTEHALVREFHEELEADIRIVRRIGVFENIYTHHGATGHEYIFAFEIEFTSHGQGNADAFVLEDEGSRNNARWVPLADFQSGTETLLPEGLLPLIEGLAPTGPAA